MGFQHEENGMWQAVALIAVELAVSTVVSEVWDAIAED
jgi:hypothetical protein